MKEEGFPFERFLLAIEQGLEGDPIQMLLGFERQTGEVEQGGVEVRADHRFCKGGSFLFERWGIDDQRNADAPLIDPCLACFVGQNGGDREGLEPVESPPLSEKKSRMVLSRRFNRSRVSSTRPTFSSRLSTIAA
jgi:hypothetical protein